MCTKTFQIWLNKNVNKTQCFSSEMVPFQNIYFWKGNKILPKCINKQLGPNIQISCLTYSCSSSSSSPWKYFLNPKHCDIHFFLNPVQIRPSHSFSQGVTNLNNVKTLLLNKTLKMKFNFKCKHYTFKHFNTTFSFKNCNFSQKIIKWWIYLQIE